MDPHLLPLGAAWDRAMTRSESHGVGVLIPWLDQNKNRGQLSFKLRTRFRWLFILNSKSLFWLINDISRTPSATCLMFCEVFFES